jgi:hypothetical protein
MWAEMYPDLIMGSTGSCQPVEISCLNWIIRRAAGEAIRHARRGLLALMVNAPRHAQTLGVRVMQFDTCGCA